MAKLVFFTAVLAALVALSAAEGDNILQLPSAAQGQLQCQLQLQQSSLDACRQVVDQQLTAQRPSFLSPQAVNANWVQAQCCQQLQGISRECRAAAIRQIVSHYEHQAVAPLGGGWYYPGQHGGSYYPGVTYPQGQGSEQQQGQGQVWYLPGQTSQKQQGQVWWYLPGQTSQQQQGQGGWYLPGQTSQQQQGQGGWYWYLPGQTSQQQQGQGAWYWYLPGQTSQQQQGQGVWYWYPPSQTFPHQQQGEGSLGESTTKQQKGSQDPSGGRNNIFRHILRPLQDKPGKTAPQQEGQHGQYCGTQSQPGFGGSSYPSHFGTDQQAAGLQVVIRARQIAAQLPAICRLEY